MLSISKQDLLLNTQEFDVGNKT